MINIESPDHSATPDESESQSTAIDFREQMDGIFAEYDDYPVVLIGDRELSAANALKLFTYGIASAELKRHEDEHDPADKTEFETVLETALLSSGVKQEDINRCVDLQKQSIIEQLANHNPSF